MTMSEQWVALRTILTKEILRFSRIWIQTLLPPMVTTALYFLIFGQLIGSQIAPIAGYDYMEYILPGIILMAVISNSYANVVSSFYGAKFQHYIDEMLVSPMPNRLILAGYLAGGVARGVAVGIAVSGVALFFTPIPIAHWAVIISMFVLTSTAFALGGFINGMYAKSFDDISVIPTFVLTPLTYLGGVFYSVDMLPSPWREISLFNPILYLVDGFRYGMLGVSTVSLVISYAIAGAVILALGLYASWLLHTGRGLKN